MPDYYIDDDKTVVICDPLDNEQSLAAYGAHKAWKDGYTADQWKRLRISLLGEYRVVRINYKTPLEDAIFWLERCYHFIGYHGSCSWLARLMGCPMTIISKDDWMSSATFPWAICESPNVELHRKWSLDKLQWCKNEFEQYLPKFNSLYRT